MRFDHPHDVQQVFLALARAALWVLIRQQFPAQGVLAAGYPHQDAMNVGRHGAAGGRLATMKAWAKLNL